MEQKQVIIVTGGHVTFSKNERGGQHMKVVLDHKEPNAASRKFTLAEPYTFEVNGAVVPFYGPTGALLEFLALPEFRERFPHLVTDHLMASGFCQLNSNGPGNYWCDQGTCSGHCKYHPVPTWCGCE